MAPFKIDRIRAALAARLLKISAAKVSEVRRMSAAARIGIERPSSGKRLGRPRTTPFQMQRIRLALDEGRAVRETARLLKVSAAKVSEIRRMSATSAALGAD